MSDAGSTSYVPDRLYERLFVPWRLPVTDWPLCREDWTRVDAITRLPWEGYLLDFGAGDGTLAAMVCSRNPQVNRIDMVEHDASQTSKALLRWKEWPLWEQSGLWREQAYDGALCCEVLEHMTADMGQTILKQIHAVLKPRGMCCVTVPHKNGARASYPGHIRTFTRYTLTEELREAGFTISSVGGVWGNMWLIAVAHA